MATYSAFNSFGPQTLGPTDAARNYDFENLQFSGGAFVPTRKPKPAPQQQPFQQTSAFGTAQQLKPVFDTQGAEERYAKSAQELLQPTLERQSNDLNTWLTSRGIPAGSEAWNRALQQQAEERNNLLSNVALDSIGQGRAERALQFGQNQAVNQSLLQGLGMDRGYDLAGRQFDLQAELGRGGLALQGELGRGQLGIAKSQQDLNRELGLGGLDLSRQRQAFNEMMGLRQQDLTEEQFDYGQVQDRLNRRMSQRGQNAAIDQAYRQLGLQDRAADLNQMVFDQGASEFDRNMALALLNSGRQFDLQAQGFGMQADTQRLQNELALRNQMISEQQLPLQEMAILNSMLSGLPMPQFEQFGFNAPVANYMQPSQFAYQQLHQMLRGDANAEMQQDADMWGALGGLGGTALGALLGT